MILWTLLLKYFCHLFTIVDNLNLIIFQEFSQVPDFKQKIFSKLKKKDLRFKKYLI